MPNYNVTVNLNATIKFKLTKEGEELTKRLSEAERFKFQLKFPREIKRTEDGFVEMQLWDFCNFYGPELYVGSSQYLEDNSIHISL